MYIFGDRHNENHSDAAVLSIAQVHLPLTNDNLEIQNAGHLAHLDKS